MKTAILYRAHIDSEVLRREYEKLRQDARRHHVCLLYDQTRNYIDQNSFENFEPFTVPHIANLPYQFRSLMYNWDYPVLYFYKNNPNYDFYWVVDYDVRFTGNWDEFFSYYEELQHYDLIGSYVGTYSEDPTWVHWGKANVEFLEKDKRKLLYSVARFSNKALRILDESYASGVFGFCEYVGPSILQKNNCLIGDFSGLGEHKILNKPRAFCNRETFRYRPEFTKVGTELDMLYHPIKK